MDWTQGRSAPDACGDYPHTAPRELVTGICLLGRFVEELTGDDLCNWETAQGFTNDTFALRGSAVTDPALPNFSYGHPGAPEAFDVTWYKECGRMTGVSRPVAPGEVEAAVATCLASLGVDLPERLDGLYVYADHAGDDYVATLLAAGRATGRHQRAS